MGFDEEIPKFRLLLQNLSESVDLFFVGRLRAGVRV